MVVTAIPTIPPSPAAPCAPAAIPTAPTAVSPTSAAALIDVEALKRTHSIETVVGRHVELRAIGRALVGACPFHDDRTKPNFYVYPDTQSWYCYRCAKGGDVIRFVERLNGLDFRGACGYLGAQSGAAPTTAVRVSLASGPAASGPSPTGGARRERRWDRLGLDEQVLMNTAAAIYQHCLWRDARALDYLHSRGIPDWVARVCGLGYADGHSLEVYLRRRGGLRLAEDLGLLRRPGRDDGTRQLREFLAGRIVVPEIRGGQPIWFIGRAIDGAAQRGAQEGSHGITHGAPKYLGLPGERPVLGYERAAGRRDVLLCEGVFDYLVAVAWRLAAWSPCGTQLPPERLGFLARARAVYGAFDGDDAGHEANARFADYLGARWRPLALPDGNDLNDLACRPGGREEFFRLLAAQRDIPATEGRAPV